jgi:hypothetical protein
MKFIRALLFLPILIFISPALLILGIIILLMDTKEGPLRSLMADEIRAYGFDVGFERFMQNVFIPTYRHNVQSFVLGGAGFLVVTVGLRGLGVLPVTIVYFSLGVEFMLLVIWAITVYYTPEEPITENPAVLVHQSHPVQQTASPERSDRMVATMKELSAQLALLENRLRTTESRFEQLGNLDASLQELSTRLNLLVSDQFNLRVRKEFEQLVAEMGQRLGEKTNGPVKQ